MGVGGEIRESSVSKHLQHSRENIVQVIKQMRQGWYGNLLTLLVLK